MWRTTIDRRPRRSRCTKSVCEEAGAADFGTCSKALGRRFCLEGRLSRGILLSGSRFEPTSFWQSRFDHEPEQNGANRIGRNQASLATRHLGITPQLVRQEASWLIVCIFRQSTLRSPAAENFNNSQLVCQTTVAPRATCGFFLLRRRLLPSMMR
jgi:hypothetical protein